MPHPVLAALSSLDLPASAVALRTHPVVSAGLWGAVVAAVVAPQGRKPAALAALSGHEPGVPGDFVREAVPAGGLAVATAGGLAAVGPVFSGYVFFWGVGGAGWC